MKIIDWLQMWQLAVMFLFIVGILVLAFAIPFAPALARLYGRVRRAVAKSQMLVILIVAAILVTIIAATLGKQSRGVVKIDADAISPAPTTAAPTK